MRFIVGYTATPAGSDALALGARLARSWGATLDIVLVLHSEHRPTLVPSDAGYDRFLHDRSEGWLADAARRVPAEVTTRTHLVYADTFSAGLMDTAGSLGAMLIVIGAAHDGIFGRFTLGSVAADLLHSSSVPVALAPIGTADAGHALGISRMTCTIGTKAGSEVLLAAGIRFAAAAHVPLRLVSLVAVDLPGGVEDKLVSKHGAIHAQEVLNYAAARLPESVVATADVVFGDSIEQAIGSLDWNPDEIVLVGSSRLAQPRRLFLGSTAAKMLRALPVPMIVVPRESHLTQGI
ncbi:universal stress protein [Glaciibacter psychrotolerans]|uniref:Nucleotide-binding universal stress UspA family protein n=1 Tax=Glaciibacter psychrotolerans TaxID=670054 RepID=A0A7Z0J5K2_9MICO|nr:universal stress protein [Leifsonia psychrotolerans]NYJ19236.1 nucleotide-binding universal stress UspA family protein [Leifsonia psychrotolerans]